MYIRVITNMSLHFMRLPAAFYADSAKDVLPCRGTTASSLSAANAARHHTACHRFYTNACALLSRLYVTCIPGKYIACRRPPLCCCIFIQ